MKRISTVLSALTLLIALCGNVYAQKVVEQRHYSPRNSEANSETGISGAMEFYNLVRGNPDVSDVVNAHKSTNMLPKGKSLTWNEIGPTNMGGRTRAILIDKNNSNTIYAGGVAGGLWKTTTGGTSWELIFPLAENYAISCITQDINGIIYFGTGEGFGVGSGEAAGSTSFMGGGIYKSSDNTGTVFTQISSTIPASYLDKWAYIYEIAADPFTSKVYACTDGGLYMTEDGGTTWSNPVLYPGSSPYALVAHDVEVASSGAVYCVVGDKVFYSADGTTGSFSDRSVTGTSASNVGRIELAVAPTDPNYIYACVASNVGTLKGVYRSVDAGTTWTVIGPGGSASFNVFGDNNQGVWNNTIKVFPDNKNHILVGGIDLWDWVDGGTWIQKSLWFLSSSSAYYLHADQHDIAFVPNNPSAFYHASDGGISKSTDGGTLFSTVNRNYSTIQFYSLSCNLFDQVVGGCQDNGTIVIPGYPDPNQAGNAYDFLGGDGGWTAMSYIDPNVIVGTVYYGDMYRSNEFGGNSAAFYSTRMTELSPAPGEGGFSGFVTPLVLDEKIADYNSPDSVMFYADTVSYNAGDVVIVRSKNNSFPFQYTLPSALSAGDSLLVQDIVQARFYLGATGAVWMTKGLHDFSGAPDWYKISTISGTAQCMAVSGDGNYLFVGTSGGILYRISNLLGIKDSISGDVTSAYSIVETKSIALASGRAITSIAIDPNDANNVIYTLGKYGQTQYLYMSTNALDSLPTFANKTGNLPKMPVYASLIELHNPNTVILGTELGIFTTTNISAASPSWIEDNSGIGRVPVYMLRQQTLNYPYNTNYGVIYAGTHGRGAFKSASYVGLQDFEANTPENLVSVYPNPAVDRTSVAFNSNIAGNASLNVYTMDGKLAMSVPVTVVNGSNSIQINISMLNAGNYLIEIKTTEASYSGKLLKN